MSMLIRLVVVSSCLFACGCAASNPRCGTLMLEKVIDGLACGCLLGLLTWRRCWIDIRLGLVSGLLLGTVCVLYEYVRQW